MKKVLAVILVLALLATGIGVGYTVLTSPAFALKKIVRDVEKDGLDGLKPHLTDDALKTVETLDSVANNSITSTILGLLGQGDTSEYFETFTEKLQEFDWKVEDIQKGKKEATVTLSFNYNDKITGTIKIKMVKEKLTWKIDGLNFPEFESFGL